MDGPPGYEEPGTARREPVLIVMSVLAAAQALTAAAGFTDAVPGQAALWIVLVIAAAQAGVQFYVRGLTTPVADPRARDGEPLVPLSSAAAAADDPDGYVGRHRAPQDGDAP